MHEIQPILLTDETVILTKFHRDRPKIVDFLLLAYFGTSVNFFVTVSSAKRSLVPLENVTPLKILCKNKPLKYIQCKEVPDTWAHPRGGDESLKCGFQIVYT